MEVGLRSLNTLKDYSVIGLFECIGTFILTIAVNFGYKSKPEIISSGLFVAIIFTYKITGSHLNASVSMGVYLIRAKWRKNLYCLFAYLAA